MLVCVILHYLICGTVFLVAIIRNAKQNLMFIHNTLFTQKQLGSKCRICFLLDRFFVVVTLANHSHFLVAASASAISTVVLYTNCRISNANNFLGFSFLGHLP
jgi:hypothetical protein